MCVSVYGNKNLIRGEEAYRILARAKRSPKDTFSRVIKRASWSDNRPTGKRLLERVPTDVPDKILDHLEHVQTQDTEPDDPRNE